MEYIKELIAQNKFWRTFIKKQRCWTPIVDAVGKLAYANGYNKAKKEQQESERWRKVEEEELPEFKGEGHEYQILVKLEDGYMETRWVYMDSRLDLYKFWKIVE